MPESDNTPLRELLGPTPECLPIEMLARLESASAGDAAARIHLEQCAYCRNELAMLRDFEAAAATSAEAPEVAWVVAELRRRPVAAANVAGGAPSRSLWQRLTGWTPAGTPRWIPAGAAAAVLLAVGSGLYLADRGHPAGSEQAGGEPVWRSAAVQVIGPAGDVTEPPRTFEWRPVPGAQSYRVRLLEVDRTEIWSGETPATRIEIPQAIARQLTPGRTFLWQVTARGAAGPGSESNLQSFHISVNNR